MSFRLLSRHRVQKSCAEISVELLLAHKADVNAEFLGGMTALHCAAKYGHTDIVKLLLAKKAEVDPRVKINGYTPLLFASETGNKETVELLLAHKANVNAKASDKENDGWTPLHCAAAYNPKT